MFVFLSSRVLLLCSQDMFYVTSRQVACVCVCVRACKLVSFGMSIGLVHELWERHQSDWARSWQVTPGTNIGQLTNRGNSTTSIPSAPCTVHSYWCICQVHQSWEQYDKYSLRSLYTAQLLVYLSSTPVVGTVRQVFPWLLVQFTVPGVFVKYTVVGTVRQVLPWFLVQSTVTGVFVQYTSRQLACSSDAGCSDQPSMSLASPSPQYVSAHRNILQRLVHFLADYGSLTGHAGPAGRRHAPLVARSGSDAGSCSRAARRGNDHAATRTTRTTAGTRIRARRVGVTERTAERCKSYLTENILFPTLRRQIC